MKVFNIRGLVRNPETGETLSLGAGKSTAARFLREESRAHGVPASPIAFADGVKSEVYKHLVPFTRPDILTADAIWNQFRKEVPQVIGTRFPVPDFYHALFDDEIAWVNRHKQDLRPLLQWYGTEFRRGVSSHPEWESDPILKTMARYNTYWTDQVTKRTEIALQTGRNVTIDDCRFEDEYHVLRKLGAVDILIVSRARNVEEWMRLRDGVATKGISGHSSEKPLDFPPDWRILNDGTLDDLRSAMTLVYATESLV